jgi:hypothetical protein
MNATILLVWENNSFCMAVVNYCLCLFSDSGITVLPDVFKGLHNLEIITRYFACQ